MYVLYVYDSSDKLVAYEADTELDSLIATAVCLTSIEGKVVIVNISSMLHVVKVYEYVGARTVHELWYNQDEIASTVYFGDVEIES